MKKIFLGPHLSIADGYKTTFAQADEIGASAIQIFTKSNRSWHAKSLTEKDGTNFKNARKSSGVEHAVVHASYLINLASPKPDIAEKSINGLVDELERCAILGIDKLVLHPGSFNGTTLEEGIKNIAENINYALSKTDANVKILLENMAGQGSSIGSQFEELAAIYERVHKKKSILFCIDTAHLFAAGHDFFSSEAAFKKSIKSCDEVIGLDKVGAIHFNDSLKTFGSKVDRHGNIDKGEIGSKALARFFEVPEFQKIPFLLETPDDNGYFYYKTEIDIFKKILKII